MLPKSELSHNIKRELARHPIKDLRIAHDHLVKIQAEYSEIRLPKTYKPFFKDVDGAEIPDDADYVHLDPWLIAAATQKLGSDPLNPDKNIYYKLWQCYYQHGKSPTQDYLELVARYKGTNTKIDKPNDKVMEIYRQWQSNEPLYSPKHIHDLLGSLHSPAHFQKMHKLPDMLTYSETVYILLVCMQSPYYKFDRTNLANINRRLEDYSQHLFSIGALPTNIRTKVGKTYGTWRLTELLSKDENTANNANILYFAKCGLCGYETQVNYRSVTTKRCPECKAIAKVVTEPELTGSVLPRPMSIYLLNDNSVCLAMERPSKAVAKIKFTHSNQQEKWTYYEGNPQKLSEVEKLAKKKAVDAAAEHVFENEENKGMKALFKRDDSLFGF